MTWGASLHALEELKKQNNMIDWSKAKKGASVKLRCGGIILVSKYYYDELCDYPHTIHYDDVCSKTYTNSGSEYEYKQTPFDIIEIIPAKEPKRIVTYVNGYLEELVWCTPDKDLTILDAKSNKRMRHVATFKITYIPDGENPDPTIEVVK